VFRSRQALHRHILFVTYFGEWYQARFAFRISHVGRNLSWYLKRLQKLDILNTNKSSGRFLSRSGEDLDFEYCK
jgi:hypothetical protein